LTSVASTHVLRTKELRHKWWISPFFLTLCMYSFTRVWMLRGDDTIFLSYKAWWG
jgi:hypothetical protein